MVGILFVPVDDCVMTDRRLLVVPVQGEKLILSKVTVGVETK